MTIPHGPSLSRRALLGAGLAAVPLGLAAPALAKGSFPEPGPVIPRDAILTYADMIAELGKIERTSKGRVTVSTLRELGSEFGFDVIALDDVGPGVRWSASQVRELIAGGKVDAQWFDVIVDTLGLRDRLGHRPSEMSGGQQQRVATARALVGRPDVVFADEPTGALDSATGAQLLEFLRRSAVEFGQTIVMVTHDPSAAAYAYRVLLFADGRPVGALEDPDRDTVIDALREVG